MFQPLILLLMRTNFKSYFLSFFFVAFFHTISFNQYFGRNKVQYEKFDFQVIHTTHFEIHFYPSTKEISLEIGRLAEAWYIKYSKLLDHTFNEKKTLILYANHPDFQQTQVISGIIDIGVSGVTEGLKSRLIMPLAESLSETNHVLGHELAHVFQYDILNRNDTISSESIYNLPLWMIEGMAEYLSLGPENEMTDTWMRDALYYDTLPTIKQVTNNMEYFPYRYGHSIWAFIGKKWSDEMIKPLFVRSAFFGFNAAVEETFGIDADSLSTLWHSFLEEKYLSQIQKFGRAEDTGSKLISFDSDAGEMNLSPVISPDGNYIIFLSEKELFSVDLFLADAHTGKIIRKLGSSNSSNHFDALNFVQSAGAWSPDSKRVAFSVVKKGDHKIMIVDIANGKVKEIISPDGVEAIFSIAWSPGGNQLVFSGSNGGMTDLYLYDLSKKNVVQLTNDIYADMQPAWSPDGKTITFATDRVDASDTKKPIARNMKIAFIRVKDLSITMMPSFGETKQINPVYSPDGKSLYFITDLHHVSNIYSYEFDSGNLYSITNVATGICGLTTLSPALSIALENGEIVYNVFEHSNYSIYKYKAENAPGKLVTFESEVKNETADKLFENVQSDSFSITPYRPRLGLNYIGNVYAGVGIGASGYGTGAGFVGGISMLFGDLLNYHNVYTVFQANGTFKDIAGQVIYLNTKRRFQWGGLVSHIPYASASTIVYADSIQDNGTKQPVAVIDQIIFRAFEERVAFLARYPVSMINRFDFNLGYSYINFARELYRTVTTPDYSNVIDESHEKISAFPDVQLANLSVAFVGDNSFFGYNEPLKGYRYRIEVEGNVGSYNFGNLLLDGRYYLRMKPFTLAFRAMHFGRYFKDAENNFLGPLYLGDEYFIRGYSIYSFDYSECTGSENGTCPEFDRLLGSKIGIFNIELRLPFTGHERLSLIRSRVFYTTLNAFFDAGVAWWDYDKPVFSFTKNSIQRVPVFSAGLSLRLNLLGALILEIYAAHPFQRPEKKVSFGLIIFPGW